MMMADRVLASSMRLAAICTVIGGAVLAYLYYTSGANLANTQQFCQSVAPGTERLAVLAKMSATSGAHLSFETPSQINISLPGACHCSLPVASGLVNTSGRAYCNG
jgi:hypothetical protein